MAGTRKKPPLSGETVVSANLWQHQTTRRWHWALVTKEADRESKGSYDTALAACRSLKDELMKHSAEF